MIIEIDKNSGFCFGVVNAISQAEEELTNRGFVNSLGDIVHNKMEMNRLKKMGLTTISYDNLNDISGNTVFIRAHGEPPRIYSQIKKLGYNIIDATCPVVAKLQKEMIIANNIMSEQNGQVVLLGKRGHAEVVGLSGQIDDNCIIIQSVEELIEKVNFTLPIYLLSQTTQPLSLFNKIKSIIEERSNDYIIKDSICRNVSNREPLLKEFAKRFDLVLFVSGADSSNGKALYEVCKSVNQNTFKIESSENIDISSLENINSVGICGATSTPSWLMEETAKFVEKAVIKSIK